MKITSIIKTTAIALFVAFGTLQVNAQHFVNSQNDVWTAVKKKWSNWKSGNLDIAFNYLHEDFLGWNEVDDIPVSKSELIGTMKNMKYSISEINYNIQPVNIVVHQNSAVAHYTYQYSFLYRSEGASQLIEDHGKWSEFLVNNNGQWQLLGEFTFHNNASQSINTSRIETFTFPSNGNILTGRVYLPESYTSNKGLPVIYLIDFTEQHFNISNDEFERVIGGVRQLHNVDALVVSLANIPNINAEPVAFREHYGIYKDLAAYIDKNYTNNPSRTFIGKGSESGVVLQALFTESSEVAIFDNFIVTDPSPKYAMAIIDIIQKNDFSKNKTKKKLHYSFSKSNDREKCTQLINLIKRSNYEWLQIQSTEYTNSTFNNTYPISYAEGIKYVFNP